MNTMLKLLGILMFISASSGFGFFKAYKIEARMKLLNDIYTCMENLKEHIRYSGGELAELLEICFGSCKAIICNAGKVSVSAEILEKHDIALLEDFFSQLGQFVSESECNRILLYQEMLRAKIEQGEAECASRAKIWRTFGICIGFAGAVMLI